MGVVEGFEVLGFEPRSGVEENGMMLHYINWGGKDKRKRVRNVTVVRCPPTPPRRYHSQAHQHSTNT